VIFAYVCASICIPISTPFETPWSYTVEISKAELNRIIKAGKKTIANIAPTGTDHEVKIKGIKGLTIRVSALGFTTYYLYYTIKGRKRKYKIGKTEDIDLATAIKLVEQTRAKVALGEDPAKQRTESRKAKKANKAEKLRKYLDEIYFKHIDSNLTKHKSAKRTKYILEHNFKCFMQKNIAKITRTDIEDWIQGEIDRGIKNSTINRAFTSLRACFNHAVDKNLITANPCKGIKRLPVTERGVVRYLSPEEEKRLYKAVDKRSGYFPVFVRLLINTGIRPREAFTLEWSAVNLKLKQITVHAAFSKTDKTRHIPLNDTIYRVIQDWHTETHSDVKPYNHVFINPATDKRIVSVQKVWTNCLKDADIQNFRLYDLRHTFASKLAMAGVEIYRISELLGHSSIEMSKVYAHLSPDYLTEAVNAIG